MIQTQNVPMSSCQTQKTKQNKKSIVFTTVYKIYVIWSLASSLAIFLVTLLLTCSAPGMLPPKLVHVHL